MNAGRRPFGFLPYRAPLLTWLVLVVGGAGTVLIWQGTELLHQPTPSLWRLLLAAALVVAGESKALQLRHSRSTSLFDWTEASVVLGLSLVPLGYLLVLVGVVGWLPYAASRLPPVKVGFNVATNIIGISLAGALVHLLGGAAFSSFDLATAGYLTLAGFTFAVVTNLTVTIVIALDQGVSVAAILREGRGISFLVAAGNIAAALTVLALAHWSPITLAVLPLALLGVYAAYTTKLRAQVERETWQRLDDATRQLSQLDEKHVVGAAIACGAELFRADTVEILLHDVDGGNLRRFRGSKEGLIDEATDTTERTENLGDREDLVDGAVQQVAEAFLRGPRGQIGLLRLRFGTELSLSPRESNVLATFARSVSTSVLNAQMFEEMRAEALRKEYEANHDSLTGLANRRLLGDRVDAALQAAQQGTRTVALLLFDLDHFKEVNDALGHEAGDLLLQRVAGRLTTRVRGNDTVARLGGDEFAVLLTDLPHAGTAKGAAAKLLDTLAEPIEVDGLRLSIEASVGVACYPGDAESFTDLLRRADTAMYQAKASGGPVQRYDGSRDATSLDRLAIVTELRAALARDEIVLHYQPKIDLRNGTVIGVEALARWQHPDRGLVPPGEFMPLVEHSGFVRDFTFHVIGLAIRDCARWYKQGLEIGVAVNLSARNLLDWELPSAVADLLTTHRLPPHLLTAEITETTMMSELEVVEEVLSRLRDLGVQLSVDDFGTGYSSLAFLQRVRVNEIKVDQTFVARMCESTEDAVIVKATIDLAHNLGLRAIAEGVETPEQEQTLTELNCDGAQGYLFSRPIPYDKLLEVCERPPTWPAVRAATVTDTRTRLPRLVTQQAG